MGDFVDDAGGDCGDRIPGDAGPVGGHEIVGGDGADGYGVVIGALVPHDADGMDAGADGEILADLPVEAGFGDFFPENGIAFTDDLRLVGGDFADDADGDAGAGEGLAPDHRFHGRSAPCRG